MSEKSRDAGRKTNIHAPWRIQYIQMLSEEQAGCFLCRARDETDRQEENLLLWRTGRCVVVMNRFPYTAGHLLIAPAVHCAEPDELPDAVLIELAVRVRDAKRVMQQVVNAGGFNIGMNLGRCAGAGLPEHVHWHLVPRWEGDTNFMSVTGGVRVIPQTLAAVAQRFRVLSDELGLP